MGDVIEIFPVPMLAGRDCAHCGERHVEVGTLCCACRGRQEHADDSYIQNTVASSIAELERWERAGNPLAGPLARALDGMRRTYDAVAPRVTHAAPGEIHYVNGEFWGEPGDGVQLGPFGSSELTEAALVAYAADHQKRDTP